MRKNRTFNIDDVKVYAHTLGYELEFHRYKRVFTLRDLSQPQIWGWVYFPHSTEKLVEKVNDLNLEGWLMAVEMTAESIKFSDEII